MFHRTSLLTPLMFMALGAAGQAADCTGISPWVATTTYPVGAQVTYGGSLYQAAVSTTNVQPSYCLACGWWVKVGDCGTVVTCAAAPSVPTGLASPSQTSSSVALAWNAATAGAGCTITYSIMQDGSQVASGLTGTSTTINNLQANRTYNFAVAAVDQKGGSLSASIPVTTKPIQTTCTAAPTVPTGLAASNVTSSSVTLNWNASSANSGCTITYQVYVNGSAFGGALGGTSAILGGLSPSTPYTIGVAALDQAGSSSKATTNVTTQPDNPTVEPSFMAYSSNGMKPLSINANNEYLGPDGMPFGVTKNGQLRTFKSIADLMSKAQFQAIFPTLFGIPIDYGTWQDTQASHGKGVLTYEALVTAAAHYPDFANHGSRHDRIRELAAMLGNFAHETTGGYGSFAMGSSRYKYGLFFIEEVSGSVSCDQAACNDYCVADATWGYACSIPPQPYGDGTLKKPKYHGRGPIQLSYNYNYGQMSEQLQIPGPSGKMDGLLYQPWSLTKDGVLCFRSGFWFWMTPQAPKPSAHDVMAMRWTPSAADSAAGRVPGYGEVVNIINGGLECTQPLKDQTRDRIGYYLTFLAAIGGTNADGTLKVNPRAGGSSSDGSYGAGDPANPAAGYCLDCVTMQHY